MTVKLGRAPKRQLESRGWQCYASPIVDKRPLSVTVIAWIYLIMGVVGFVYHIIVQRSLHPFPYDLLWVELIFVAAILSGAYMLRGHNWARWLALAWIAFHVVLSIFHNIPELAIHALLCAVLAFFLFRSAASRYFRATGSQPS